MLKEYIRKIANQEARKVGHDHILGYYQHDSYQRVLYNSSIPIDMAVLTLWEERSALKEEIAYIHAYWIKTMCGNCTHQVMCKRTNVLKYGQKCADKKSLEE